MRICWLSGALACVLCLGIAIPQETSTNTSYVVVFEFKGLDNTKPTVRINCVVVANTEGEAVIRAYKYLADSMLAANQDRLVFLEAQKR